MYYAEFCRPQNQALKTHVCLWQLKTQTINSDCLGATVYVKKINVPPAIRVGHSAALTKAKALYLLSRIALKTYSIPQGSRIWPQENLFLGTLLCYVVIGMVDRMAFTSAYHLNLFNFRHADWECLALNQDSRQIPAKAFQPQFDQNLYVSYRVTSERPVLAY